MGCPFASVPTSSWRHASPVGSGNETIRAGLGGPQGGDGERKAREGEQAITGEDHRPRHGWVPVVIDRSPEMLAHAARKGLETITADAQQLPLADESFDAAMLVSMLHHVEHPPSAVREAVRVLRPGGRLAFMGFTRQDIETLWFLDYFPSTRAWMIDSHMSLPQLLALLPGTERHQIVYRDLEDGSLMALASHPEHVLEERWRSQTSYFERLTRENPHQLDAGLRRLASDIAAGLSPAQPGRGTALAWMKPH
jgi:SAM-dependent methyltransferase